MTPTPTITERLNNYDTIGRVRIKPTNNSKAYVSPEKIEEETVSN